MTQGGRQWPALAMCGAEPPRTAGSWGPAGLLGAGRSEAATHRSTRSAGTQSVSLRARRMIAAARRTGDSALRGTDHVAA
ncbi:hypothetical protein AB0K47_28450 [Streptomyces tirandamycinicus]|uniref:hypothetical protein n=1 Tax=Streptomyces tirandamycinicus TaxID=2174846 RepID=UPI003421CDDD